MAGRVSFPFERRPSPLFGSVHRPIARVGLWSRKLHGWLEVAMLVDSGADYTLLPNVYAAHLGLHLVNECQTFDTMGIGGSERVYLKRTWPMRLGAWRRDIPIGFLTRNDIPPLLGRQACLETFRATFFQHRTTFSLR
jgi:hypothetical protein